jgi:hypothetical protein
VHCGGCFTLVGNQGLLFFMDFLFNVCTRFDNYAVSKHPGQANAGGMPFWVGVTKMKFGESGKRNRNVANLKIKPQQEENQWLYFFRVKIGSTHFLTRFSLPGIVEAWFKASLYDCYTPSDGANLPYHDTLDSENFAGSLKIAIFII